MQPKRPCSLARAVFCASLALGSIDVHGQTAAAQQPSATSAVVLEVQLDQVPITDALTAYQHGGEVYLPLGELARLLTIAVRTDAVEGRADGYVLDKKHTFTLDLTLGRVTLAGHAETLDRTLVDLRTDDIYVASRLLARWLPVDLQVDMSGLLLHIHARQQLPLMARLARGPFLEQRRPPQAARPRL